MNGSELVREIQQIIDDDGDLEVLITDGYEAVGYRGAFRVAVFEDVDGSRYIDIGVGGTRE